MVRIPPFGVLDDHWTLKNKHFFALKKMSKSTNLGWNGKCSSDKVGLPENEIMNKFKMVSVFT